MSAAKKLLEEIPNESKTKYVVKDVFKEPDTKKRERKIVDLIIKHIKSN